MKREFVPPVPLIAYAAACRLSPTAAVVYQLLLREMLLQRADEVYISLDILGICDISQSSYANALVNLENAGLITTNRPPGRRIRVTLVPGWWTKDVEDQVGV